MMQRLSWAAVVVALGSACSSSGNSTGASGGTSGGSTTSGGTGGSSSGQMPTISVSGTAYVHPVALALYDAGLLTGTPPSLPGVTVHIDEPLQIIEMEPDARQGTTTLDDAGAFAVAGVDPSVVIVGLVATLVPNSPDAGIDPCESAGPGLPAFCSGFATSATAVFEGSHPTASIANSVAYGDPVVFEEYLNTKLESLTRLALTSQGNHLIDQGIVLGYVVNGGVPVPGAVVDLRGNTANPNLVYVDDNFDPVLADGGAPTSTNKYGVFFMIAPGAPTGYPAGFGIVDHLEYGCQSAGSNPGSIFNLIFDPATAGHCN